MSDKIKSRDEIIRVVQNQRKNFKTIVFTNGCFDLLHIGHVKYLQKAKSLGDILVVGVNNDDSIRRTKTPPRPLVPERERAEILAALSDVDYVVIFSEDTPNKLIEAIRPDIHVKGGDYKADVLPEAEVVRAYGGKVVVVDKVEGQSTTKLIESILEKYGKHRDP